MTIQGGKRPPEAASDESAPRFAPLKPFAASDEQDVGESLQRMAVALKDLGASARVHVRVIGENDAIDHWEVQIGARAQSAKRSPRPTKANAADVVVAVRGDTWRQIAQGSLSPYDAMYGGKLRVGGNLELAKRLVKRLSDPSTPYVPPC